MTTGQNGLLTEPMNWQTSNFKISIKKSLVMIINLQNTIYFEWFDRKRIFENFNGSYH